MAKFNVFERRDGSPVGQIDAPSSTQACQKMAGRLRGMYPGKSIATIAAKLYAHRIEKQSFGGRPRLFG